MSVRRHGGGLGGGLSAIVVSIIVRNQVLVLVSGAPVLHRALEPLHVPPPVVEVLLEPFRPEFETMEVDLVVVRRA